jgi:uncharacterized membrane protein YccC
MEPQWLAILSALAALLGVGVALLGLAVTMLGVVVAFLGFLANALTATSACCSTLIVLISAIFVWRQVTEIRLATRATSHKAVTDMLSNEHVVASRRTVFTELDGIDHQEWTKEQREAADAVCRTYDAAGQMVDYQFLDERYVADHWAHSLEQSWRILKDYVKYLREKRSAYETWDNFERLAKKAERYRKTTPDKIS